MHATGCATPYVAGTLAATTNPGTALGRSSGASIERKQPQLATRRASAFGKSSAEAGRRPRHASNFRSPATHVSLTLMSAIASGLTL